ncbi:MAG TPA: hypothetical protein VGH63_15170 [Polyangia bacterium]
MRALLIACLLSLVATPALAENRDAARAAYRAAAKHYDLGEFADALASFKEAYRNYEDPSLLFNIGQCERMLGQNAEAVRSFRAYLQQPDPANRTQVEELINKLQSEIDAQEAAKRQPPEGTIRPDEPAHATAPAPEAAVVVTAPPPAPRRTPIYKKWWLWTAVGVVAVGVAVGVGVGVTQKSFPGGSTTDGTFRF